MKSLEPIAAFNTETDFEATVQRIGEMVEAGQLIACGLDRTDRVHFVEIYETENGEVWHLAHPDQAFRGYLRCVRHDRLALESPK